VYQNHRFSSRFRPLKVLMFHGWIFIAAPHSKPFVCDTGCGYVSVIGTGDARATKGSTRKFATVQAAVEYIRARRIKKGWGV
jgi:hypothetical protein